MSVWMENICIWKLKNLKRFLELAGEAASSTSAHPFLPSTTVIALLMCSWVFSPVMAIVCSNGDRRKIAGHG